MGASQPAYGMAAFKVTLTLMSASGVIKDPKPVDSSGQPASCKEAGDATIFSGDNSGRLDYRLVDRERIGRTSMAMQFRGMRLGNLVCRATCMIRFANAPVISVAADPSWRIHQVCGRSHAIAARHENRLHNRLSHV